MEITSYDKALTRHTQSRINSNVVFNDHSHKSKFVILHEDFDLDIR